MEVIIDNFKRASASVLGSLLVGMSSSTNPGSTSINLIPICTKVKIIQASSIFSSSSSSSLFSSFSSSSIAHPRLHPNLADELEAGKCVISNCRHYFSNLEDVLAFPGPLVVKSTLEVIPANGNKKQKSETSERVSR